MTEQSDSNRTMTGRVISNKMEKTITVLVERREKHPLYGKFVGRSTKVHAYHADDQWRIGGTVTLEQWRALV